MSRKSWQVSRRTFLRGTGAAIALPWMESLARGGSVAQAVAPKAPVRFGCLYFPNGAWMKNWTPTSTGKDYEIPFSLAPMAEVRDSVLVLSGLDKKNSHE